MFIPKSAWLDPAEKLLLVEAMVRHGLIKFSNARNLPLKKGGFTDVYINLRDARNSPEMLAMIARAYESPIRRLNPDRFIEVPDAVSCFAGHISTATGIPYITIREKAKEGRVAKADAIGSAPPGSKVVMFDDVITDGESKVAPFFKAGEQGWRTTHLVVLVDRQQGWQQKFAEYGINLTVWPGMTLHDVRKILIQDLRLMKRCDPDIEGRNHLIVALDGKSREEMFALADALRPSGSILKVNDLAFAEGFETLVPDLEVYGRVMLDLKLHDIPNTVANTCKRIRACAPWALTVHATGSAEMMKSAVGMLAGTETKVLAVTVLTSIDKKTSQEVYHRLPLSQVKSLAKIAAEAGVQGFVCSPEEAKVLRALYPRMLIVTPGIRFEDSSAGDQARIATPKKAMMMGADYVVMGRDIIGAADPVAQARRVQEETSREI